MIDLQQKTKTFEYEAFCNSHWHIVDRVLSFPLQTAEQKKKKKGFQQQQQTQCISTSYHFCFTTICSVSEEDDYVAFWSSLRDHHDRS